MAESEDAVVRVVIPDAGVGDAVVATVVAVPWRDRWRRVGVLRPAQWKGGRRSVLGRGTHSREGLQR